MDTAVAVLLGIVVDDLVTLQPHVHGGVEVEFGVGATDVDVDCRAADLEFWFGEFLNYPLS